MALYYSSPAKTLLMVETPREFFPLATLLQGDLAATRTHGHISVRTRHCRRPCPLWAPPGQQKAFSPPLSVGSEKKEPSIKMYGPLMALALTKKGQFRRSDVR